ncbi:MAG: ferredoxin [Devosia sp.]
MTYVITEQCIDIKDGSCAEVCPVDSIYEGGRMFYIHPDECINCGLCLSVCPVDAVSWEGEIKPEQSHYIAVNAEFFGPEVTDMGSPGGWEKSRSTVQDHPAVARHPVGPVLPSA